MGGLLRRLLPQSLAARTLAALTLGFAMLFAAMVAVHDVLLRRAAERGTEELLALRLASLIDAVAAVPPGERERVAHALSREDLSVHWRSGPALGGAGDGHVAPPASDEAVSSRTGHLARSASEVRVRAGTLTPAGDRLVGIAASARLPDGSWLDVELSSFSVLSADQRALHAYAAAVGAVLLLGVGLVARSVAAPVASLAAAVSRLSPERDGAEPLPATGPREVRQLAEALNGMAARTRDAFRQRTLALGALSHDLMSPIARLKLRAEDLAEPSRSAVRADLGEMETMVSDVLAYLRGGGEGEPVRPIAVAALVRTVADESAELGAAVEERGLDEDAVAEGRRVAIKRAVANLVANAASHGQDPWVAVERDQAGTDVLVRVGDSGPGIPAEDLPRVTEPFFRGDRARGAGGGSGLGLSTARAIAEAHGGALVIESAAGRGTVATLRLPARRRAEAGSRRPAPADRRPGTIGAGDVA